MIKPPLETIRISRQGREQLVKLRRNTGLENWNILCRWAFCVSLKDLKAPTPFADRLDGGVEMTWKVFAGDQSDIYAVLATMRARVDGVGDTEEAIGGCVRAHLHRGLGYLASGTATRSLSDLTTRWLSRNDSKVDSEILQQEVLN